MIDKETLISIAKLNNLRPWQQEKHYIQTVILTALSEYPLIFKGGTYLWFFHGLNRFSEDLDFTASGNLPEDLDKKVSETLRLFGIENEVKRMESIAGSFSFRISAKGPLFTTDTNLCYIYVEVSRRENIIKSPLSFELAFDAYRLPIKILNGMSLEEIAAEKVRAVITRNTARDLYDLFYLITERKIMFDEGMVNKKLKYYNLTFSYELYQKKVKEKKKIWKSELKQLVLNDLPDCNVVLATLIKWGKKK